MSVVHVVFFFLFLGMTSTVSCAGGELDFLYKLVTRTFHALPHT